MEETVILVYTVIEPKIVKVPVTNVTTAEDVCIYVCKQLNIGPVARHIFALREYGSNIFLALNGKFSEKSTKYDFRIRYKVASITNLKRLDIKAYDYYFHQARNDVLENKIPDIVYEKYKRELIGLGVADMYRVMLEKDIARDTVESDYRKYIPKEVIKRHSIIFIKKPIHDSLGKIKKSGHDAWYVKAEYLKQLEAMAPEYLSEEFKAVTDLNGVLCNVHIKVTPFHPTEPGILICYNSKKEEWTQLCTIGDLCFVSVRNDGTVEISRKNGIPSYLKYHSVKSMQSFVSLLDGYYRLMVKWIFNLCKDIPTPSLQKLYAMKCHGPVGGEFSYAKLEEKRNNRPGCFILRESETKYNIFYIDVCSKQSMKPKSYKLEKIGPDDFIFNDDLRRYKSIQQLMAAYSDPDSLIYLQECLPPSEYDRSPLMLCHADVIAGDFLTDVSAIAGVLPSAPLVINTKDLQVYKVCKLSHLGLEYLGTTAVTESGARCQSWTASKPIHKVDESFVDDLFPERSMRTAKNYCRNPNRNQAGPWCYTLEQELIDDTCDIPLCSYPECKLTGAGMDYSGTHNRARSGKKCLKWDKHRKKVRSKLTYYEQKKFPKRQFPDESRGDAKKYCRNPDGDTGGPWCFVDVEGSGGLVEKQYCDIPFCDSHTCETFTKDSSVYTHYTAFNESITNLTFGVKLWDSDSYLNASARILLTLFALPLPGEKIDEMQIGVEIYISNKESAMTLGNKATVDYEITTGILKSSDYTFFSLMWGSGFVTLSVAGVTVPIFLAEYKWKKNLFGVNKNQFFFYSIQGTNVLWSLPLCDEEDECEIHTTTSDTYERYWPLQVTNSSYDVQLFVRAFHSVTLLFQPSPVTLYPCVKLSLASPDNTSKITMHEYEGASENTLKSTTILKLLNYWDWQEFLVTFFGDTMQVYWVRDIGTQMLMEVTHTYITGMRWFSPGSLDCMVHWTFFCSPREFAAPPNPWPPECVLNKDEKGYKGTQSVTSDGYPCAPWAVVENVVEIGQEEVLKYWNYCRDPFKENSGTYCYTLTKKTGAELVKKECKLRLCRSAQCRMAGTGNDYIGKENVTRSNRTCQKWTKNTPHKVAEEYLNYTLYADQDINAADNYCRDPSRNIAGPWCYTTDKDVPQDLCNIRDCAKTEECIVMTKGNGEGRSIYILPQWKEKGVQGGLHFSLKEWNPDLLDGIIFEITPLEGDGFIKLVIGADQNERVLLFHGKNRKGATLKKEKTLPHLIPAGKWASFWLQMRKGEVMLGYEGVPDALFEWIQEDTEYLFEPMFMTYMSIEGNIIGVHFKCSECHTERTDTSIFTRIMPLGLWSTTENLIYNNISFYLRGTGVALIPLILLPGTGDYYGVTIGDYKYWIIFAKNQKTSAKVLKAVNLTETQLKPDAWTHFVFTYTEYSIEVFRNNVSTLYYESEVPMLFYWFSVGAEHGWVTWSANCEPPDIDGAPKDGGWSKWSEWQCTVSCGGGDGVRTRTCSNPYPNIYGKMCPGAPSSVGRCNEFECGEISPKTLENVRYSLKTNRFSYVVDEGANVVLENNKELLAIIRDESPKSYYQWSLNGVFVKPRRDIVEFIDDDIVIKEAALSDTGVYVCMLYRVNGKRLVLQVVSLAVTPRQYNLITRETYEMTVVSNAVVLGYVYTDLSQKWMINDFVYIDYGITTLAAVSSEYISLINATHDGLWTCIVEQRDLQLSWVTNIVRVQVKKAPNFLTHLMEDQFTAPFFGKFQSETTVFVVLVVIIILVFVIVYVGLYLYLKYGTLPKRIYRRKK